MFDVSSIFNGQACWGLAVNAKLNIYLPTAAKNVGFFYSRNNTFEADGKTYRRLR